MPLTLGTALAPAVVGSVLWPLYGISGFRLGSDLITGVPLVSHLYLGDPFKGILFSVAKGIGLFTMEFGVYRYHKSLPSKYWQEFDKQNDIYDDNSTYRNFLYTELAVGGSILLSVYAYELWYLYHGVKKSDKEKPDDRFNIFASIQPSYQDKQKSMFFKLTIGF